MVWYIDTIDLTNIGVLLFIEVHSLHLGSLLVFYSGMGFNKCDIMYPQLHSHIESFCCSKIPCTPTPNNHWSLLLSL